MALVTMATTEEAIDALIVSVLFKTLNDVEFNLFFLVPKLW